MSTVFLFLMGVGGLVLVVQIVLSFFGIVDEMPDAMDGVGAAEGGLNLLSVRAISAAAVFFGAAGLVLARSLPDWLAAVLAVPPAVAAAALTAWLTRLMFRMESSGSLQLDQAGGQLGTVYLPVPGSHTGTGIVQFTLQGRTVELRAYTRQPDALATGAPVLVVSVDPETETAEVIPTNNIEGLR
jgi:hypothetical protein